MLFQIAYMNTSLSAIKLEGDVLTLLYEFMDVWMPHQVLLWESSNTAKDPSLLR